MSETTKTDSVLFKDVGKIGRTAAEAMGVTVVSGKDIAELQKRGKEVLTAAVWVGEKYLNLCKFIRERDRQDELR